MNLQSLVTAKKPTTHIVSVSPDDATRLLKKTMNGVQRKLSDAVVRKYAGIMQRDQWMSTGESIIISDKGTLLDGQHRLKAIIKSGRTAEFVVVSGVEEDAFHHIDQGKSRGPADVLSIYGYKDVNCLAAAISRLYAWRITGNIEARAVSQERRATAHDYVSIAESDPGLIESLKATDRMHFSRKLISKTILGFLHYVFGACSPSERDSFFHMLNNGGNVSEDNPIHVLRERLLKNYMVKNRKNGKVFSDRELVRACVQTWNACRNNETWAKFKLAKNLQKPV